MSSLTSSELACSGASFVAEVQGLDGSFTFSELVLQKIWLRGEFLKDKLRCLDGRPLRILNSGRWNRQAGPDFQGARLHLGEVEIQGDVELHLHAGDWETHRHVADPAYDRVVLHVVLFPPSGGRRTFASSGVEIPILVMLPLLPRDMESFALDDAAEVLAGRPALRLFEVLRNRDATQLVPMLRNLARRRWHEKVQFARFRVERLGWTEACHHAALECLGYSGNRAAMLKAAGRWPLAAWVNGDLNPDLIWTELSASWRSRCGRPANHPLRRLHQYRAWVNQVPFWPEPLALFIQCLPTPSADDDTAAVRSGCCFTGLRDQFVKDLSGEQLGGTRLDTFICDACIPLLATKRTEEDLFGLWYHWQIGDIPDAIRTTLSEALVLDPRFRPKCNGLAQGLMAWWQAELLGEGN